ncbi:hypothetical protein CABS02_14198 [Colletotrichum abscissum]|uniref:C2H2-type domain-containing protein n=1 Tax=Colletotrichum abscissum TaxID=1671311 RepID=A0A9P9X1X7_9PEZI|nr:hypothetical protein CABS02_14198 [Colletotrichum abscissum]
MAVTTSGTYDAKSTFDPVKNADGKFPCNHYNKVYKRKSKFKRHLLRHRLDDGGYHDGRHLADSAIDTSGQVGKMQKYDMPPVQYEMFVHEEACETSSATEKYIQYLEHFDVSTGMSSIPHTAPEQPHLLCDSAMEVHPEAQS